MKAIIINGARVCPDEFAQMHGLTVGDSLDLSGTGITSLPDGLTVGGGLCLDPYDVKFTHPTLQIGCQSHTIAEWEAFDDRAILAMDGRKALDFWRIWKEPLLKWALGNGSND